MTVVGGEEGPLSPPHAADAAVPPHAADAAVEPAAAAEAGPPPGASAAAAVAEPAAQAAAEEAETQVARTLPSTPSPTPAQPENSCQEPPEQQQEVAADEEPRPTPFDQPASAAPGAEPTVTLSSREAWAAINSMFGVRVGGGGKEGGKGSSSNPGCARGLAAAARGPSCSRRPAPAPPAPSGRPPYGQLRPRRLCDLRQRPAAAAAARGAARPDGHPQHPRRLCGCERHVQGGGRRCWCGVGLGQGGGAVAVALAPC